MPDWSYGLYIWHWPVYQTLKMAVPDAGPALLLTAGLAASVLIAALSWTFIERPALGQKERLTAWLRRAPARPGAVLRTARPA